MPHPLKELIPDILEREPGLTDRALTDRIKGPGVHPSQINQACRAMVALGQLRRSAGTDGCIGNYIGGTSWRKPKIGVRVARAPLPKPGLGEDEVKRHLASWLQTLD